MGLFNLGGLIGAFAPPKTKKMYNNDLLQGQIDKSIGGMDAYRTASGNALAKYGLANDQAVTDTTHLYGQSENEINDMMSGLKNSSYMGDRERARAGDLAALTGLLGAMGGGMSAADKVAASRLGYAGRPSSTYMDKARQSYIGAFASPLANTIFGNLNNAASGAAAERGANVAQRMGLMGTRNAMPSDLAAMQLNPLYALQQSRDHEVGQLSGLGSANNQNFAGFKTEKNKWAAAADAVDESLNTAADMYLSNGMPGLGGMGGLGGMMGGGASARGKGGLMGGIMGGLVGGVNGMNGYNPYMYGYSPYMGYPQATPYMGYPYPAYGYQGMGRVQGRLEGTGE